MEHRAADIRAGLNHPVIYATPWMEPIPVFLAYLTKRAARSRLTDADGWRRNDACTAPPRNARRIACGDSLVVSPPHVRQGDGAAADAPQRAPSGTGHRLRGDVPSFGLTLNALRG